MTCLSGLDGEAACLVGHCRFVLLFRGFFVVVVFSIGVDLATLVVGTAITIDMVASCC